MPYGANIMRDGELNPSHFALISIDIEGQLHLKCSQSIANNFQECLLGPFADTFLKAVAMSGEEGSRISQAHYSVPVSPHQLKPAIKILPPRITHITPRKTGLDSKAHTQNFSPSCLSPSILRPDHTESSPHRDTNSQESRKRNVWSVDNKMWRPEVMISIIDRDLMRKYYERAFRNLQQTNCRALAKAYIKLVEPRKQVYFPYNGRKSVAGVTQQLDPEAAKPPWWPPGVSHREPDHLLKEERIRLLIHILCELHTSHRITTKRLRQVDQPIRRHILPAERLCIIDEIYRVRQAEIDFLEGKSDGQSQVWICRMNMPEAKEATFKYDEPNGESISLDAASINTSNAISASVESGSINNTSPGMFAPVADFPVHLPLDHPYDVQPQFPGKPGKFYAGQDPKTPRGFGMTVPVSRLPQRLKRKRESNEISPVNTTGTVFPNDLSSSATVDLQPYPVGYPDGPCTFSRQGFMSSGPFTTEALAQPKESRDIPYHFGYSTLATFSQ